MVDAPTRDERAGDIKMLTELMAKGSKPKQLSPVTLAIRELQECPSLFQPRHQSLLWPGRSNEHVKEMFRSLRSTGKPLEAIKVVWFGSKWFVVDGHHRLEAYKLVKWKSPVPVKAVALREGKDAGLRIREAELISIASNVRDKLPMSALDKADTAWRMTFFHPDLSKAQVSGATTLSTSLVAYMRRAKGVLVTCDKFTNEEIGNWRWLRARHEYARLVDPDQLDIPEDKEDEFNVHLVARAMSGILGKGVTANNIVEAFYRMDPTLIGRLEEALEQHRAIVALNI